MTGTTRSSGRHHRAVGQRRARAAMACLLTAAAAACMAGTASDATAPGTSVGYKPPPPPPPAGGVTAPTETDTVLVTPHTTTPSFAIAPNFLGLSFEIWEAIDNPRLADPVLERFLTNLGPGVLRFGGGTADQHWWNPTTRSGSPNNVPVVINSDLQTMFAFSRAVGWPVIYAVNLVNLRPDTAAAEVKAVAGIGGSSLLGIAIGNEPDHYVVDGQRPSGWGESNLDSEWTAYANAIQARTPAVKFVGLDGCCTMAVNWLPTLVSDQSSRLLLGTQHIYTEWVGATPGTNNYPSISNLMDSATSAGDSIGVVRAYAALGGKVPLRITESNTVANSGAEGVSNVFAASLWGMDFMYTMAEHGAVGVNFHGSFAGGYYAVVDGSAGSYTAQPLYYAMLAFHNAAQGQIVPLSVTTHQNVRVHATVGSDGTLRVTAINRGSTNVQVRITPGRTYSHAGTLRLTGPSLSATSGITFAGSSVSSTGVWTPAAQAPVYTQGGVYAVSVPATSAAVITLSP